MKKTSLAAIAALTSFASFANISNGPLTCRNIKNASAGSNQQPPIAYAVYISKCGDTWDFQIPYTSLKQVPKFMTQMMADADQACGTNINYYEY